MHKIMADENATRKQDGKPPLTCLPKPCDFFDLIGGTNTGGCVAWFEYRVLQLISILQYNRPNAWATSDGCRHRNKPL